MVRSRMEEPKMIEYLEGKRYRRVILDGDMDGDVTRKGCRVGEQFCDVCRGKSKRRVRMIAGVEEEEGRVKRVRLEDSTPVKYRQTA
jgi:hypothetical protein